VRHLEAIEDGVLAHERFQSYRKLEKEHAYEARRRDKSLALAEKRKWKQIHAQARERMKAKGR
jgi:ribosome biogenesis GTPase